MNYEGYNSEIELIRLVSEGNEPAFEKLVGQLFDRLYGFTFSLTKSAPLTEEIIQDVYLRVWQNRAQLPAISNVEAWIFTITRNLAYNAFRAQLAVVEYVQHLDHFFAPAPGATDDHLLYKDSRRLVEQAVTQLPPQQAAVFRMSRLEGLSLDEIAASMQLSKETVKKHLARAMVVVRKIIHTQAGTTLLVYCCHLYALR